MTDRVTDLLEVLRRTAATTRDRQLVAIASAYLAHDDELALALVHDHLTDHPDSPLAVRVAARLDTRPDTQEHS